MKQSEFSVEGPGPAIRRNPNSTALLRPPVFFLGFMLSCAGFAASSPARMNLLPQGDFKNPGARTDWAEGFNIPQNQEFRVVSENGKNWLRIENHDAGRQLDYVHAYVKLSPEIESLTISVRMRAHDLKVGKEGWHNARIAMSFEGGSFPLPAQVPELSKDSDWITQSLDLEVPKGAARLNLQPAMFYCTGVFEIADLTLTPHLKSQTQLADAVLPAGLSLDWERAAIQTVNAKRDQVSLNGIWRFIPAEEGVAEPPALGWGYLKVPGSWQTSRRASADFVATGGGPLWDLFDGTRVSRAWYQRQVAIPKSWEGRSISLRLERVCTDAIVYVDSKECGRVAWPWGSVDITSAVRPGQMANLSVLVAAIADAEKVGTFWQNAFMDVSYAAASLKSRGLTGSVFLESRVSEAHVTDVFVRTSTRNRRVSLDIELAGVTSAGRVQVQAEMLSEQGVVEKSFVADAEVSAAQTQTITVSWPWTDPRLWDIGQPNLYTLRLKVKARGMDDESEQKFGFREFWVEGRQLYLNGSVLRLRQPCFYNGPRMQVGDNFSENGDSNVDMRGDTADSGRSLDEADRQGYLIAQYVLNANKYMMNSKGRLIWQENRGRALERAAVWMRHYRNHPSIIMWIAGFNFFNNAVDADPRRIGRRGWDQNEKPWDRYMAAASDLFEGLKTLDNTRAFYSHAGAYTGDIYTMNCYLDMLPLQEREDWLSAWAESGEMPVSMVEFGTPMDCTFRRGHHGFDSNITSEPLLTEFAAIYFGPNAYASEEPQYRQFLHDLFRSGMLYQSSENRLDNFANNHKIQQLYRINTWRSWRTAGLPGGLRTWSWMQDALAEVNGPTLAWIGGPPGAFTAKDHHFSSAEKIQKQILLINDTRQPQDFTAKWSAAVAGKEVGGAEIKGRLDVSEIRAIPIQVIAPAAEPGHKLEGQIFLSAIIGESRHQDHFDFRVFGKAEVGSGRIAVVDDSGLTTGMLRDLGYQTSAWDGGPAPLVVIGRNMFKQSPSVAARLEPFVRAGGRALICAQDPQWMVRALGWRVCPKIARRVFTVDKRFAAELDADDLRDWNGASTLIEAFPEYVGDYLRGNEREQPYAGWHWGNRGGVSSAPIEKPHCSGWRPLLECEFDLAYTPLMELDYGQGRLIVCTLDLEDHAAGDPAAHRVAARLFDYALHSQLSPRLETVEYLGGAAGAAWLRQMGVRFKAADRLGGDCRLLLVGPDAVLDSNLLTRYLQKGGRAFFLPLSHAQGWLGTTLERATAQFAGSQSVPDWPETRGLSASDLRWRSYLDSPPWILSQGLEVGADGLIGRKKIGQGMAVFCQVDPDSFRADEKTYFRYTRWRATRAIAQLLANLGADFEVDRRIFHPLDTWSVSLDGAWQLRVTHQLSPATTEAAAALDPGISKEAKELIGNAVSPDGWTSVNLPQMLACFQDQDGEVVLRKEITIPSSRQGRDLILSLGVLHDFDQTFFNGEEVGHTDLAGEWRSPREYVLPGKLAKAGKNVIAIRLFNRFGPGGFTGQPGLPVGPNGDRSGPQATGPRVGLGMVLRFRPDSEPVSYYHQDYRTDFPMGDNPYRYYRW